MKKDLFDKINLGGIDLENRIVRSAAVMSLADDDGCVTQALIDSYKELSDGGVGLIITGALSISEDDVFDLKNMRVHNDSYIEGLKKLVSTIHNSESKIVAQIGHSSNLVYCRPETPPIAPSGVIDFSTNLESKEMSLDDIEDVKSNFVNAALRCKEAGFDGVQVHAAHGYLLSKFLTPFYNQRTDIYGGSLQNRLRIIIEIINKIKEVCGNSYPVFLKINSDDFVDDKDVFTFKDCKDVFKILCDAGINAIEMSGGLAGTEVGPARMKIFSREQEAYHRSYAETISNDNDISIILVGGIRSLDIAQDIVKNTNIQAVSLARPLISEPDLVLKWKNNTQLISRCISCNKCFESGASKCILNK